MKCCLNQKMCFVTPRHSRGCVRVLLAISFALGLAACQKRAARESDVRESASESEQVEVVVADEICAEEKSVQDDAREWAESWKETRKRLAVEREEENRPSEPVDAAELEKKRLSKSTTQKKPTVDDRLTYITAVLSRGERLDDVLERLKPSLTNEQSLAAYYLEQGQLTKAFCHYARQEVKKPGGRIECRYSLVRDAKLVAAMENTELTPWIIWRVKSTDSSRDKVYWQWLRQEWQMPLFSSEKRSVDLETIFFGESVEARELWCSGHSSPCIGIGTKDGTLYVDSFSVSFDSLYEPISCALKARLAEAESGVEKKRQREVDLANMIKVRDKLRFLMKLKWKSSRDEAYHEQIQAQIKELVIGVGLIRESDFDESRVNQYYSMLESQIRLQTTLTRAEGKLSEGTIDRLLGELERMERSLLTATYSVTMEVDGPPGGKLGFQPK